MSVKTHVALLGLVLAQLAAPVFALRFEAEDIRNLIDNGNKTLGETQELKEIKAINNLGNIVGVNSFNAAVLVKPYDTHLYYKKGGDGILQRSDDAHYIMLPAPCPDPPLKPAPIGGAKPQEITSSVAVDVTDAKLSTKDEIVIAGSFIDKSGLQHAVYWDKENIPVCEAALYYGHELPPWKPSGTPVVGTADVEAKAVAINNNGVVVGISYDAAKNPRPVYWKKVTEKVKVTVKVPDKTNPTGPEVDEVREIDETLYRAFDLRSTASATRPGEVVSIAKGGKDILGILKRADGTFWDPVVWNQIDDPAANFEIILPIPLFGAAEEIDNDNYVPPARLFERGAMPTYFGDFIGGWYEQVENGVTVAKPISWFSIPRTYQDKKPHPAVIRAFSLKTLNGIDGKILTNSSPGAGGALVGESGNRGMIISGNCGAQDINSSFTAPLVGGTVIERLTVMEQSSFPPVLVGEGQTGTTKTFYFLRPVTFSVDVSASIKADHDRIEVGQSHTYTIIIKNEKKADPTKNNQATCLTVRVDAAIYVPSDNTQKLGGMTFLSASSDKADCKTSIVDVSCTIHSIEPEASIEIKVVAEARPLLADRLVRTSVVVSPSETDVDQNISAGRNDADSDYNADNSNNTASILLSVDRKACFIATAAYGSYLDPHVAALRKFRDESLASTLVGQKAIEVYYSVSPPMAEYLLDHPWLKPLARTALTPLVIVVEYPGETAIFLFGLTLLGGAAYVRRKKKPSFG